MFRRASKRRGEREAAELLDGAAVDVGAGVTVRPLGDAELEELLDDDQVECLTPRPEPVPPRLTIELVPRRAGSPMSAAR